VSDRDRGRQADGPGVNPQYVELQLARALATAAEHHDPETRARAHGRVERWARVLSNLESGRVAYGSRVPVKGLPPWVTLEVMTGGFATGEPMAGGPLQDHELELLDRLPPSARGRGRTALNLYFLTDEGLAHLTEQLRSGRFRVEVPEEGALLVVAWLLERSEVGAALDLVDLLEPFFGTLRFFPVPADRAPVSGATVHVRSAGEAIEDLRRIAPNRHILAQREAVAVWAPFLDRLVAHFLETCEDGWPLRREPEGWRDRGRALLTEYRDLREEHQRCRKPEKRSGHFAQLLVLLERQVENADSLSNPDVARIRLIVDRHVEKWGPPESAQCRARRKRQREDVRAVLHSRLADVVADRFEPFPPNEGVPNPEDLTGAVDEDEGAARGIPAGTVIPEPVRRKAERCREDAIEILVERRLIGSGDVLAAVLPQMTAVLHARALPDPVARRLYEAVYRAFRRRRSLLLLNLESQVRLEELPWIQAFEVFREERAAVTDASRTAVRSLVLLQLTSFPQAIVPNTLLQEVRALARASGVEMPLVEELAADIFMGRFSAKYQRAAATAAGLLRDTLYTRYYGIDWRGVGLDRPVTPPTSVSRLFGRRTAEHGDFGRLCLDRAGLADVAPFRSVAANGMIIEQQQILTTQNLAVLYESLELAPELADHLEEMARRCFRWICVRLQTRTTDRHAELKTVKNAAYAWRQMIFFLSLAPVVSLEPFLDWGRAYLADQDAELRVRFLPAWKGLLQATEGRTPTNAPTRPDGARQFLGWSESPHWLLEAVGGQSGNPRRL
jgi:hypothetical protein